MRKRVTVILGTLFSLGAIAAIVLLLRRSNVAVLNPRGHIAQQQFDLLVFTAVLSLVVVLPVFAMTFYIVWKYRESNTKAKYQPEWDHSRVAESIWWLIPFGLITILAVVAWVSSHRLDPYRPLQSAATPITVQVVALDWKWLFIYPEQHIASVNELHIPTNTPINFRITADAPMNSLWIPNLGGQVYAMAGMQTKLHLIADKPGNYHGSSANISGEGFAGMHFMAKATARADFDEWVGRAKKSPQKLTTQTYDNLAKPSKNNPVTTYTDPAPGLFDAIIAKYMAPGMHSGNNSHDTPMTMEDN